MVTTYCIHIWQVVLDLSKAFSANLIKNWFCKHGGPVRLDLVLLLANPRPRKKSFKVTTPTEGGRRTHSQLSYPWVHPDLMPLD